ncbi:MAG TPA: hypothetical protein DEB06_01575 [Phycisphaerales bacterium]|nr:hypothetical protein [Phycisphaerales bacterium]
MSAPGLARTAVGCMTGTSIDALDAALVELRGSGLGLRVSVRATASWALGPLGDDLRRAASGQPAPAGFFASLSRRFGEFHAERLGAWLDALSGAPDLVCVHGQTVFHAPPDSWQLIDASPIVRRVGAPTVFDLRRADLSCGGQGAPITPIADWVLFRDDRSARAVVNLGGFCNITRLGAGGGPETVRGSDVCACNQVLDAIARSGLGAPFDEGGRAASSGSPHEGASSELGAVLGAQRAGRRSLGTGDEAGRWVERWGGSLRAADLAASACAAIGREIGGAIGACDEALLGGGGVRNRALVGAIASAAPGVRVRTTDELGVPAPFRESVAMAVLGALCADGVAITLPAVTGVAEPAPIAGVWAGLEHFVCTPSVQTR